MKMFAVIAFYSARLTVSVLDWEPEDLNLTHVSQKPTKVLSKEFNHFKREFENKLPLYGAV
jgi:hypothetical protein